MRLWSIHPKYLDRLGLTALWRESLLAQKVLLGKTKGYTAHPQLDRFRACSDPILAISCYLSEILKEADRRGYRFDRSKIAHAEKCKKIYLRTGQIAYEWGHLQRKLRTRDPQRYKRNKTLVHPVPHPLFKTVSGGKEAWERDRSHSARRIRP